MKVGVYNRTFDYGGVTNVSVKIHQGLKRRGIKSELICFVDERNIAESTILNSKGLFNEIKILSKYINEKQIEVIILTPCIHTIGIKICSLIKRRKPIKIITIVHMRPKFWLLNKTFNNKITNFLTRSALKISDYVISVSSDLAKELLSMNLIDHKKIVTIYNPIIEKEVLQHSQVNIEEKEIIELAMVGWIYELKGQHTVIEALHNLNSTRYRLNIIGGIKDQKYYNHLLKMIEDYKLDSQVRFIGVVDNVKEYLQSMDLYVLASHSEALPTVLIEALECGIPIIASNCKWGPAEILEDNKYGILYEVGDVNSLAREINKLTTDNTIYNYFRQTSYLKANEFCEDRIIELYYQLITR